jgi:hypothetical protein
VSAVSTLQKYAELRVRDLIITETITLDGVIDAALGWFTPGGGDEDDQSDVLEALREQQDAADALLVGRAPANPSSLPSGSR